MKNKKAGTLLRLGISLLALGIVVYTLRGKLSEALTILRHDVNWYYVLAAFAIYFVSLGVIAVRLRSVFAVQSIRVTFRESYYLTCIGLFFNLFFPSAVGGDVAKAYYAYKHSNKKIAATTSVLLDRLMGFVAIIIMALVAVSFFAKDLADARMVQVVYVFLGLMILTVCFFASRRFAKLFGFLKHLIPSEKWRNRLSEIYSAIYYYKRHPMTLLFVVLLSFAAQTLFICMHYAMTLALGVDIGLGVYFILIPLITIASMAPSLGGLGVREAGTIYLFSRFMPAERALALSILLDILIYLFSFGSGIFYALKGGLKGQAITEMEDLQ